MAEKKKKFGSFRRKKSLVEDGGLRPLIPQLQLDCISYLEKRAMQIEGILRISGSNLTIKELQKQYEKGKDVNLEEIENVHTVACLLKNHFRDAPEPLLTFERYDDFVNTIALDAEERLLFVKALVGQLPESNQEQLHQLLGFLNKVGKHSLENKMDLGNLSTMFGPNLMRAAEQSPTDILRDMQGIRMVMLLMLQNRHDVFPDWPDEQLIKPDRIKAFRLMEIAMNKDQFDIDKELMLMEIESGYRLEKSNRYGSLVKVGSHGKSPEVNAAIETAQSQGTRKAPSDEKNESSETREGVEAGKEAISELADSLDLEGLGVSENLAERERAKMQFKKNRSNKSSPDMGVSEILIRDRSQHRKSRKKTASNPTGTGRKNVRRVVSADRHEFSAVREKSGDSAGSPKRKSSSRPSSPKGTRKSHKVPKGKSASSTRATRAASPDHTPHEESPADAHPERSNSAPTVEEVEVDKDSVEDKRSKSPKKKKRRRSESTKKKRAVAVGHNTNHGDEHELELAVTDLLEKNQKVKKNLMRQLSPRGQRPPPKKK